MFDFLYDIQLFVTFFAVVVRIAAILNTAPVFGSSTVKPHIRMLLAVVIAMICIHSVQKIPITNFNTFTLVMIVGKEVLLGASMGLMSHFLFAGVQFAGQIVGTQMGFSVVNVFDPQSNTSVSIISSFLNIAMILIFISLGGHLMVIQAIIASFKTIPVGIFPIHPEGLQYMVKLFSMIFVTAIKITAPVFVTLLVLQVVMGIIGRMVPQINLMIVGFPIQIAVGLSVLAASMNYFYIVFEKLLHRYFEEVANLIRYL
ncbi:MAG: flagellar biosynthetic protein FliR [Deferribacterales bacterium]